MNDTDPRALCAAEIPGFSRYRITKDGVIFGTYGGKLTEKKQRTDRKGYPRVSRMLPDNPKGKSLVFVHRALMLTFRPIKDPQNFEVDHIDGDAANYSLGNLRWCTQAENMAFAVARGVFAGERNNRSKLTDDAVRYIRKNYIPGINQMNPGNRKDLCAKFGISRHAFSRVICKDSWNRVKD